MKAGSSFAAFLSKGTILTLPKGAPLSRSRAAAAAAVLGVAFLAAGAAHAQTAAAVGTATQPRVVAPTTVPPYATSPKTAAATTATAPAPAPKPAAAPAPASTATPTAAPAPTPGSIAAAPRPMQAAPAQGQVRTQTHGGDRHDGRRDRRDDNSFRSLPFALGAALGMSGLGAEPGYVAPSYATPVYGAPAYQQNYVEGPVYGPDPYAPGYQQGGGYEPGYRAEDARNPGYAPGRAAPVPPQSRPLDPGNAGRTITFGPETLDAQEVMATVAAARVVGVTPASLLALQSRSLEAVEAVRQQAGQDDPNMPIDGPYAYSIDRWQSALSRFGSSIGIGGAVAKITGGPSGSAEADRSAVNALRSDAYVSGLMAAAEMKSNDTAYRQAFGAGPMMAELVIGHHVGQKAMLQLSQIMRQAPGTPLLSVVRPEFARDLVMLTGMAHVQPPRGQWTVGEFVFGIDNALKNSLTRYASADRMALPVDYKPAVGGGRALDEEPRPGYGMRY